MKGRGKREIPKNSRRPAESSGTIPTCKNSGAAPPRIEPEDILVFEKPNEKQVTPALKVSDTWAGTLDTHQLKPTNRKILSEPDLEARLGSGYLSARILCFTFKPHAERPFTGAVYVEIFSQDHGDTRTKCLIAPTPKALNYANLDIIEWCTFLKIPRFPLGRRKNNAGQSMAMMVLHIADPYKVRGEVDPTVCSEVGRSLCRLVVALLHTAGVRAIVACSKERRRVDLASSYYARLGVRRRGWGEWRLCAKQERNRGTDTVLVPSGIKSGENWAALNTDVLRTNEDEARCVRSSAEIKERGEREVPEKTHRPTASSTRDRTQFALVGGV
ncbi:hypothetical protein PR048_012084 [Dryococelus australis]|uniref:Uncharacterized protein n=1 Tax=Dryococelus australis TaxID=614101 RepID=A0ABQ9HPM6_9NEOP|nr:hypothetical protein PR048_012084 [Dryococelus australis]